MMRADKTDPHDRYRTNPRRFYANFADWLLQHPLWIVGVVFAYAAYLATTEEV